jgi:drug/metabolite transporter (DMT)-like permease
VLILGLAAMLFLWTFNYIVGKMSLRQIDPVTLAVFRFELAALVMLAIYFLRGGPRVVPRRADLGRIAFLGIFGVVLNQGGFTIGLNFTSSDHSAVIAAVAPVMVLLFASILRLEDLTLWKTLGMAISFCGVLVLETEHGCPSNSPFLKGDLITLVSTVGYALYAVFGKKMARAYDAVSMNTYMVVTAAVILLPLAIRQGIVIDWRAIGWLGWSGVVYMAVCSSVAAYTIFYWALRYMEASRVAVVSYFQPVAVILFSVPILGERPTRHLLAGTALVLLGVYLAERVSKAAAEAPGHAG